MYVLVCVCNCSPQNIVLPACVYCVVCGCLATCLGGGRCGRARARPCGRTYASNSLTGRLCVCMVNVMYLVMKYANAILSCFNNKLNQNIKFFLIISENTAFFINNEMMSL